LLFFSPFLCRLFFKLNFLFIFSRYPLSFTLFRFYLFPFHIFPPNKTYFCV
jgi:hypothetical protein